MIVVDGVFFDGRTAASQQADIELDPSGSIVVRTENQNLEYDISEVRISSRLANTPRSFYFPDGAKCDSQENDRIDDFLASIGGGEKSWVYLLESRWRYVAVITILTPLAIGLLVTFGIPVLAERAAMAIPASMDGPLSEQVLTSMDSTVFEPSTVSAERRDQMNGYLQEVIDDVEGDHSYRLEFRHSEAIGANAFALPSGIIVFTDSILEVADDDRELIAVLAHEVGHVVHRHTLRQVIQGSTVTLLIATLTGDLVSVSALAATLPVVMVEAKYSREFETEADRFALQYLSKRGISPDYFAAILMRLEDRQERVKGATGFLDSHPASSERVALMQNP
jgi:Zn-dependent protease with chaperone function|tara:strand:+ start:1213 stop:2226 length:1014 start_codon:yes stop_codon:yes gene_type:complete